MGFEDFQDVDATIFFIRIVDRAFDILNSRTPYGKGYKAPLTLKNLHEIRLFAVTAKNMLTTISTENEQLIIESRSRTGFIGFIFCLESLIALGEDLLRSQDDPYSYVLSYKFSQDRLELFFNAIRGALGWNNNPSARQFQFIYRRFLAHAGVISDSRGNCLDFSSETDSVLDIFEEAPEFHPTSAYIDNIVTYIAGFVVRKVLLRETCPECRLSLISTPQEASSADYSFIRLKNNGGLITPSQSVVKTLKVAETVFRGAPLKQKHHLYVTPYVLCEILPENRVFTEEHFSETDHHIKLIRSLIFSFCTLRSQHFAKQTNLRGKNFQRPKLTKQIHFLSQ